MREAENEPTIEAPAESSGRLVAEPSAALAIEPRGGRSPRRSRWLILLGVVFAAGAGFLYWQTTGEESDVDAEQVQLTTTPIQIRDLAEFEELEGTLEFAEGLTFNASVAGSLTFLAEDGTIVERGDVIAVVSDELTELQKAQIDQSIQSAESQVASARSNVASVTAQPSEAEIINAEVAVQAAQEALDDLLEPPSDVEVAEAALAVEIARDAANDARDGVEPEELLGLRQQVEQASANLASARNGVDTALVSALSAQSAYCSLPTVPVSVCDENDLPLSSSETDDLIEAISDFLSDGDSASAQTTQSLINTSASYDNALNGVETAEVSLEVAQNNLSQAEEGATPEELDRLQIDLTRAAQAYDDLVAGPGESAIAQAESSLFNAQDRLSDLIAGADPAAVTAAYSSLESARAGLEVQRLTAAEQLATGPTYTVLMYGTAPAWRNMSIDSSIGSDVSQLEENLVALGFDADGSLVVDGVYDEGTSIAVSAWQESLGLEPTGEVSLGSVVYVEGPSLVDDQLGVLGSTVNSGSPLLSLTPTRTGEELVTTQRVVAQLPLSDRSLLDIGTEVAIDLPDGTDVPATVLDIGNVPLGGGADGSESYVEVEIRPFEPIDEVWIGADVDVEVVSELAADVLAVPVSALLALVEGGYAIELPDGNGVRLVGVETGMFADGYVEISGAGLEPGMDVVVPR